jgi:hypothetical protein
MISQALPTETQSNGQCLYEHYHLERRRDEADEFIISDNYWHPNLHVNLAMPGWLCLP